MVKAKDKKHTGNISFEAVMHIDEKRKTPAYIYLFRYAMVLMGAFGALFCFLTSVRIDCNYVYIAIAAAVFCTLFSAVFMLGNKLRYISAGIILVAYFAYVYINRAILINGMLNTVNIYFSTVNYSYRDTPFAELIFEFSVSQHTTLFIIAIAFLICFMLSWGIVYRTNIVMAFLTTFPMFEFGMYYGLVPNYAFFIMLIACWGGVLSSEFAEFSAVGNGWRYSLFKKVSSQGSAVVCTALIISFLSALIYVSASGYKRPQKLDEIEKNVENYAEDFSIEKLQEDVSAYSPFTKKSTGAINHGELSKNGDISFNNKTVLEVTMPKTPETFYLRGFTGTVYTGSSWEPMSDSSEEELSRISKTFVNSNFNPLLLNSYYWQDQNFRDLISNVDIKNISADKNYMYLPINVSPFSVYKYDIENDEYFKNKSDSYSAQYYNIDYFMDYELLINSLQSFNSESLSEDEILYRDFVYNTYLSVPEDFPAADIVFDDRYKESLQSEIDNSLGDKDQLLFNMWYVKTWLKNNCSYSLNAGKLPFGKDFVTNFIVDTKQGSCSHFASAAVLLLRYQGIPARYTEGYIIKPSDFNTMKNDGETDTVEVTDARGHAWVEIYIDGYGWYPFEVTSGYGATRTDETTTFSDTFEESVQTAEQIETVTQPVTSAAYDLGTTTQHEQITKDNKTVNVNDVFLIVIAVTAVIAAVFVRRYIIVSRRKYKFSFSRRNIAAGNIYKHFQKILSYTGIKKGSESYEEFCRRIRKYSDLFDNDRTDTIINIALKAKFSGQQVTCEEISEAVNAVQTISDIVYKSLKRNKKLVYKYLLCLI